MSCGSRPPDESSLFIELIDRLRCPRPHALDWLVAIPAEMHERDIVRGTLGCPTCRAVYPIERGIADFALDAPRVTSDAPLEPSDDESLRLAALLGLLSPGGVIALIGAWSSLAPVIAVTADSVRVIVVDPSATVARDIGVSVAVAPESALPLRPATMRGLAIDAAHATHAALIDDAVRALSAGGRMVAPASVPIPRGVRELARDERHWVAERDAIDSDVVPLRIKRDA